MTFLRDRNFRLGCLAALVALTFARSDAHAGMAQSTFTVTGNVIAMCTITTAGITFTYDPVSANATTAATATGAVTIACTKGSSPTIGLDGGLNAGLAAGAPRAMKMGSGATASYLGYDIYWPGTTTSWTTANPFVPPAPTSKAARSFNMDGSVPANQDVAVGTYTDTVTATVNF